MSSRILPLLLLIATVWVMIFVGLAGIFLIVVPLPDIYPDTVGRAVKSVVQVVVSGIFVILWLYSMWQLRNFYVRRKILTISKD